MSWKSAYLESRILSASPIDLVNIMYEHAILKVREARQHLAAGDVASRSRSVSKAIAIVSELESTLDHAAGGEIAANLAQLYRYMRERLTAGNLKQADAPFAEVERLLESLGEAWRAIDTGSHGNDLPSPWLNASAGHIPTGDVSPSAVGGWSL